MKTLRHSAVALATLRLRRARPRARSEALRGLERIETVVVIYAENRGFDNLYGLFPGANGTRQRRRRTWPAAARPRRQRPEGAAAGLGRPHRARRRAAGDARRRPQHLPNRPFAIDDPKGFNAGLGVITHEPRGTCSTRTSCRSTAARTTASSPIADAGALVMGHYSRRQQPAAVEDRAPVHARRQLLHGRVRRLVPQSFLARSAPARRNTRTPTRARRRARSRSSSPTAISLKLADNSPQLGARRRRRNSCATAHSRPISTPSTRCSRPISRAPTSRPTDGDPALCRSRQARRPCRRRREATIGDLLVRQGHRLGVVRRRLARRRSMASR